MVSKASIDSRRLTRLLVSVASCDEFKVVLAILYYVVKLAIEPHFHRVNYPDTLGDGDYDTRWTWTESLKRAVRTNQPKRSTTTICLPMGTSCIFSRSRDTQCGTIALHSTSSGKESNLKRSLILQKARSEGSGGYSR